MAYGSFQASCRLSTPAFDMKTQTSYSSHPQNPIQSHGHWDQPVAIARTKKTQQTSDLQVSDF